MNRSYIMRPSHNEALSQTKQCEQVAAFKGCENPEVPLKYPSDSPISHFEGMGHPRVWTERLLELH